MVSKDHDDSLVGGVHSGHHVGDEVDEIAQNVQSGDRLFCCCGGVLLDVPFSCIQFKGILIRFKTLSCLCGVLLSKSE